MALWRQTNASHLGGKNFNPQPFPTFTTSRPQAKPGFKPAGLHQCSAEDRQRWSDHDYRFPPYQYQCKHCLSNKQGELRVPNIEERETIMGFPRGYTLNCLPKKEQGTTAHMDTRLTLVGNSWNVTVVAWLLSKLGFLLGMNDPLSVQQVVERTAPGSTTDFQTFLQRPLMKPSRAKPQGDGEKRLVYKFLSQVSLKGEDIMLQATSEEQARYQRLRASIPAKLWKWKTAASWAWGPNTEHINVLECRAVLTSLRWRLERHHQLHCKFVHLVDSLVVLHSLSRGRSSSRKLRRTILRINALLLATRSQAVWAYVHTGQNPADAPSRRPQKRKWR